VKGECFLRCEVCGRKIRTDPVQAIIEGARLTVCIECSKHGKVILHEESALGPKTAVSKSGIPIVLVQRKKAPVAQVALTQELTEDYSNKIRVAREKLQLSHEDLGKKINEKASVLRHIEAGKMAPNNLLATKLEHALRIKLLVPISDEKSNSQVHRAVNEELTLGDLIEMGKKSGKAPTERKRL
jgi:putative transcription factor